MGLKCFLNLNLTDGNEPTFQSIAKNVSASDNTPEKKHENLAIFWSSLAFFEILICNPMVQQLVI